MMYLGGKSRTAKNIAYFIRKLRKGPFVEPFCGGCNVTTEVSNPRYCSDVNYYLIKFWQALQRGYVPPEYVDEDTYYDVRNNKNNYPPELVAFIAFGGFGGRWFQGYPNSEADVRWQRHHDSVMRQAPLLKGVEFQWREYDKIHIPDNSIIYCDPPFHGTKEYSGTPPFDSVKFWSWCRMQKGIILVSECQAPDDFISIWENERSTTLHSSTLHATDKLFMLREQYHEYRGLV